MCSVRTGELQTLFTPKEILLIVSNESQHTYRPDVTYVNTLT